MNRSSQGLSIEKAIEGFTTFKLAEGLSPRTIESYQYDLSRWMAYAGNLSIETIILILLDTGLRASEFCALSIEDVDMKTGKVELKHGQHGGAKNRKGRTIHPSKVSRKALWRYLAHGRIT